MEVCIAHLPASNERVEEYRKEQATDPICSLVISYCRHGWPNENKIASEIKPYWKARGELTVHNDTLLLYNRRIVVPKSLQRQTLQKIHTGHQGIQRCRLRAKSSVWWPGISQTITDMVKICQACTKHSTPRSEPMIPSQLPDYPWQRVSSDLFQLKGAHYIVVVDYFSRYPEVTKLSATTSNHIIEALKKIFSRHGVPETVVSDNGPQYASREFSDFAKAYDFRHITSSPHYAQSNGHAQRAVKTVKKPLYEAEDPYMALLTYRSAPFPWCGLSPAQLLMGRQLRANMPLDKDKLSPEWKYLEQFRRQNEEFKERQKRDFDRRHRVQPLPLLPDNSEVWVTTGDQPVLGRVVSSAAAPRSYIVDTPSGHIRRNRSHLNPIPQPEDNTGQPDMNPLPRQIMTRSRTRTAIRPPDRL